MDKRTKMEHVLQTEQITRIKVPRHYAAVLWLLTFMTLVSIGLGAYSYISMPSRISKYVSQHKSELKGARGEKGAVGDIGPAGISGTNGSSGGSGSLHCTTYGISNQFTDCY
jgi:uncharacterized membrane protein YgcG